MKYCSPSSLGLQNHTSFYSLKYLQHGSIPIIRIYKRTTKIMDYFV